MRYELSDYEWTAIKPILPNKPRGVRRVNDRRVLNGIFWVLHVVLIHCPPRCEQLRRQSLGDKEASRNPCSRN
jgi:hypothetical protein